MAIALRAVGTIKKADTGISGTTQSAAMPIGHVSGDWLLWTVLTDDNGTPTTPSGWALLKSSSVGTSTKSPYNAYPKLWLYHRIDNGSLGSQANITFASGSWPTGNPAIIMWITGYSGLDQTGPVEIVQATATSSITAAQNHPQVTTVADQDWLIHVRVAGFFQPPATYTISGGSNTERVDTDDGFGEGLGGAYYDTNAAVSPGLQTQRQTTASRTCEWGSIMATVVIKPAAPANAAVASAQTAEGFGTAFSPTITAADGPWDLCAPNGLPFYSIMIDWNDDEIFAASSGMLLLTLNSTGGSIENTDNDIISDIAITYGRDQNRQLNPAAVGAASFQVINVDRKYSPENPISPLFGDLEPARHMHAEVTFAGTTYDLFDGRIDDYDLHADLADRTVNFSFLDGLNDLQGVKLSTEVYQSMRTGELIDLILDLAGWEGGRDIDDGATIVPFWWVENVDAFSAINDLVKSEGPPAIAYVAPGNVFTFRDRHHRILREQSISSQATFYSPKLFDCTAPAVTGLTYTAPFEYSHGWRDIVNTVTFEVQERAIDAAITAVWTSEDQVALAIGQSAEIEISTSDPFLNAITPVSGTDFTTSGAGTVNVVLSRTSGQSTKITLLAVGGSAVISGLQLRGQTITVKRTVKVNRIAAGSITQHGERTYPESAPWANTQDAGAIADMILLRYSQRRPTVTMRVVTSNPQHFIQVLRRTISDRITIINDEIGLNSDFFIERVTHTIQRINQEGRPPVHAVVFGCEKDPPLTINPFRFDVRGAGFDDGVFDPLTADNPATVFIFGDADQGKFDTGLFGT